MPAFSMRLDSDEGSFPEASGLGVYVPTADILMNSPSFYPIKMPGLGKVGNIVLSGGTVPTGGAIQTWAESHQPQMIFITLWSENAFVMSWTLQGAIVASCAADSIEIAYDSLTITVG